MKKNLAIRAVPASTMVELYWEGGGELPDSLKGSYTNTKAAQTAIAQFMGSPDREEQLVEAYKKDEAKKPATTK